MPDEVRIGVEPPPVPPPRSSKVLALVAGLVLLAAAGAWLAGIFGEEAPTATTREVTFPTTSTTAGPTTTLPLDDRLAAARLFWRALGAGDASAAAAAFPAATPAAADLMGFAAAFRPGFTVGECTGFAANAVQCAVTVANGDLLTRGNYYYKLSGLSKTSGVIDDLVNVIGYSGGTNRKKRTWPSPRWRATIPSRRSAAMPTPSSARSTRRTKIRRPPPTYATSSASHAPSPN
jgi:hypothetical protein